MKRIFVLAGVLLLLVFIFLAGLEILPLSGEKHLEQGRVHIHKPVYMPQHTPKLKDQTLIFFGYVGCADICTPRLHEIASMMKQYQDTKKRHDLSVLFINLDPETTTVQADTFAKSFHPDFIGVSLPKKELTKITSEFNMYYSSGLQDKKKINHSQNLYLLRKDYNQRHYLRNIYIQVPYNAKIILHDLMEKEQ